MGRKKSSGGIFAAIAGVLVAIVGLGLVSKVANFDFDDDGKKTNTSTGNGNTSTDDVFDQHVHEWELVFNTPATCSAVGYNEYECFCGETQTEELPTLAHTWANSEEIAAPTCTTGSRMRYTCSVCGDTKEETLTYNALGHISVPALGTATCTEAGYTSGTYCSRCNVVLSGMEEVESLGHEFTEHIGHLDATCGADGYVELGCTRCDVTQRTTLPATGLHELGEMQEFVAATCYKEGYKVTLCTACGEEVRENLSIIPHSCDEDGVCSICGNTDWSQMSFVPSAGNYIEAPIQASAPICGYWFRLTLGSKLNFDAEKAIVYDAEGLRYEKLDQLAATTLYYDITQTTIPLGEGGVLVYVNENLKYWTDDTHTEAELVGIGSSSTAVYVTGTINVLTEASFHTHAYAGGSCSCGAVEVDPFAGLGETVEQTIVAGELMVGNWYRVYRDSSITIKDAGFVGLYCNTEGSENWGSESLIGCTSSELCYFVYENYYDFYVFAGSYKGLVSTPTGNYVTEFTIPELATVDTVSGTAYRLETPCEHSYNADYVCTKCGKVSADYATNFQEVDVTVGELVAGNWYRVYRGGCAVIDLPEQFAGIQAHTENDYPLGRLGNLCDHACYDLTYVVTEEYIDFYLAAGTYTYYTVSMLDGSLSLGGTFTIDETTSISETQGTVKRLTAKA